VPRPANIIRSTKLNLCLPEDIRAWLDIHLWSDAELRVPLGSYQRLILSLLRKYRDEIEGRKNDPPS